MINIQDIEFECRGSEFRLRVPEVQISVSETVAVVGPSGTGKTTILNLIAGILVPSAGRMSIQD